MSPHPHIRILEALGPVDPDRAVAILAEALACTWAARSAANGESDEKAYRLWWRDAQHACERMMRERRELLKARVSADAINARLQRLPPDAPERMRLLVELVEARTAAAGR